MLTIEEEQYVKNQYQISLKRKQIVIKESEKWAAVKVLMETEIENIEGARKRFELKQQYDAEIKVLQNEIKAYMN